ncbi:hypothetical protein [Natronomonas sp.]|uniref:hypothetical protein n=1 Tax=Natronomonas sp. TaxID=2184060 RepID=UPI002632C4CD|nr:hypothetical protein [Natronomonas sp.]
MRALESSPGRDADPKSVLFCSACGRSAPMNDGWALEQHDGRTDVDCPRCGAVVVSQPRFEAGAGRELVA